MRMTRRSSLPKYLLNYISKFKKKKKKDTFKLQTNSSRNTACNSSSITDNNCNDDLFSMTPKFEDIIASDRFFMSPGTAGSLMEEARLSSVTSSSTLPPNYSDAASEMLRCGGVAVVVYTCDPSCEFRQSMQEMVSTRHVEVDWEFMEELLLCYLQLNDQSVHKYILRAFAELTFCLMLAVELK